MPNIIPRYPWNFKCANIAKKDKTVYHLKNQEFDFLLIIPEYRAYCHLEVKAAEEVNGACIDQLKKENSSSRWFKNIWEKRNTRIGNLFRFQPFQMLR